MSATVKRRRRALRAIGMRLLDARPAPEIDWTPRALIRLVGGAHIICFNWARGVVEFSTVDALRPGSVALHTHTENRHVGSLSES